MKRILAAIGALILVIVIAVFSLARSPQLGVPAAPSVIGDSTPVTVHVVSPHGVRELSAAVEQDGKSVSTVVAQEKAHRLGLFRGEAPRDFTFSLGRKNDPALHEGKARVIVTAKANDLIGKTSSAEFDVNVVTSPPRVVADGAQHYINQAGAELVTFTPSGYVTESGVQAGSRRFRSFPLPSDPQHQRFSLFAMPWDQPAGSAVFVYATNPTGTVAQGSFWTKIFPKQFRTRDIQLTDDFLNKAVNDIDPRRLRGVNRPLPEDQPRHAGEEQSAACRYAFSNRREVALEPAFFCHSGLTRIYVRR